MECALSTGTGGAEYHQHNPNIADGVAGLGGYFEAFPQLKVTPKR